MEADNSDETKFKDVMKCRQRHFPDNPADAFSRGHIEKSLRREC